MIMKYFCMISLFAIAQAPSFFDIFRAQAYKAGTTGVLQRHSTSVCEIKSIVSAARCDDKPTATELYDCSSSTACVTVLLDVNRASNECEKWSCLRNRIG